jgi:hypothetical protein
MFSRTVTSDERATDSWATGRHVVRVVMTLVGAGLMLFGGFMDWARDVTGDRLSSEAFIRTGTPTVTEFWRSAALVVLVVALIGLLGLATARGGLTRLAGALAIAAFALFAIQLGRAGDLTSQLQEGPWLVLAGGVVLVLGGMPSTRRRVRERRVRGRTTDPTRPDMTDTSRSDVTDTSA